MRLFLFAIVRPKLVSAFGHPELVSGSTVTDAEINSA